MQIFVEEYLEIGPKPYFAPPPLWPFWNINQNSWFLSFSHLRVVLWGLQAQRQLVRLLLHRSRWERPPGAHTGLLQHDRWDHWSPCAFYDLCSLTMRVRSSKRREKKVWGFQTPAFHAQIRCSAASVSLCLWCIPPWRLIKQVITTPNRIMQACFC